VRIRALAAAALVFSFVPVTARAEPDTPAAAWIAPAYRTELLPQRVVAEPARVDLGLPRTTEPTISRGAKIAIIVCAIVVGVIIIFGVASIRH